MEPKIKVTAKWVNRLVNRHYKFSGRKFDCADTEYFDNGFSCNIVNGIKYANHESVLKELRYQAKSNILQLLLNDLYDKGKIKAGEYWVSL